MSSKDDIRARFVNDVGKERFSRHPMISLPTAPVAPTMPTLIVAVVDMMLWITSGAVFCVLLQLQRVDGRS